MTSSNIIATGAEAVLIREDGKLIKKRIKKGYRLPVIDEKLRKQRTKKESKLLEKASKLIPVPKVIKIDEKSNEIVIEYLNGKKLSETLDNLDNNLQICHKIGENIAKLHDAGIIHGDLTTSNMIYVPEAQGENNAQDIKTTNPPKKSVDINNKSNIIQAIDKSKEGNLYFIDFGLGYESVKTEDKAVDLHLIKQALEAKHFQRAEEFFKHILEGYKTSKYFKETIKRLEAVEKRGRYKQAG